jgi:hypothetical protein
MWAVKIINEFINMQRETGLLRAPPQLPGTLVYPPWGPFFAWAGGSLHTTEDV